MILSQRVASDMGLGLLLCAIGHFSFSYARAEAESESECCMSRWSCVPQTCQLSVCKAMIPGFPGSCRAE
eukprot:103208-Hanusia_phi.AAC.1